MNHLDDHVDALLSPDADDALRRAAREHLASCEQCRRNWQSMLDADAALRSDRIVSGSPMIGRPDADVRWQAPPRRRRGSHGIVQAAVLLMAIGLSFMAGRWSTSQRYAADSEFLLLLAGSNAAAVPSDSLPSIFERFRDWTADLRERGLLVTQAQLRPDQSIIPPSTSDGLPSAVLDGLGALNGFFLIRARDDAEALRIARGSPYLELRGHVIVRAIAR